jgi:LysM repeat protein
VDEKRDAKALGIALATVPISIIGSITGADMATAAEPKVSTTETAPDKNLNIAESGTASAGDIKAATSPSAAVSSATQLNYTVRAGDTISGIARKFQLSANQLLEINGLNTKSLIVPGQKLRLIANAVVPSGRDKASAATIHVVKRGETIAGIAKLHSISITTVLSINNLSAKAIIFPGQRLKIGSVIPKQSPKVVPAEHTVQTGETLASIAAIYGIQLQSLLTANGFTESSLVYGGQKLKLKPETQSAPSAPVPSTKPLATPLSGAISSTDPHRPSSVCEFHGYHTVKTGESVSKIAAVYGVTTQSILSANALTWSAMIYVGQKLVIPGVHEIKFCPDLTKMTAEMKSNAEVIFKVGRSLGISDYGIVIAFATAMQESSLKNLSYGDRDSVGLFQQRPSAHWGTVEQIMNPEYAARAFFGGRTSPTFGAARGLLDIKDWSSKSLTQAAQAVQISAYPNAYAKWEQSAWVWLDEIMTSTGTAPIV